MELLSDAAMKDWSKVADTILSAALAYGLLIILLRVSGKRTLSQLYIFDFVVTVAIGSILATMALSSSATLARGVGAVGVFVLLQGIVSVISSRSKKGSWALTAIPTILWLDGQFRQEAARAARLGMDEIAQAVRQSGKADPTQVYAVLLETNGQFSVIAERPQAPCPSFDHLLELNGCRR